MSQEQSPLNASTNPASPSLEFTPLEPMILMSAVPVDMNILGATDGSDFVVGGELNDYVDAGDGDDLVMGADGDDEIHGGDGDDSLMGEDGNDRLFGGAGNDMLDGYTGDNTIDGGAGSDYIMSGMGNDTIDGGTGVDVVDYFLSPAGIDVDLTSGHVTGGGHTSHLTNVEAVIGSRFDDTFRFSNPSAGDQFFILGSDGNNTIDLTSFNRSQLEVSNGVIRGQVDGGQFEILFNGVGAVEFADTVESFNTAETRWPTSYRDSLPASLAEYVNLFEDSNGDGTGVDPETPAGWPEDMFPPDGNPNNPGGNTGTVTVDPVNDPPLVHQVSLQTNEDVAIAGNIFDEVPAEDVDGMSVVRATEGPFHGTISFDASGQFTFIPNQDFFGTDAFTLEISDGTHVDRIVVTVNTLPVSDAPRGGNDAFMIAEDTVAIGNVLANDIEVDGEAMVVTGIVNQTRHGHVTIDAAGNFRYTPRANYNGLDEFSYRVTDASGDSTVVDVVLQINPVNDGPQAVHDEYRIQQDVPLSGNLLSNDSDIDGDAIALERLLSQPVGGVVRFQPNGQFSYTPLPGFVGTDTFEYVVRDAQGATSIASVTVFVDAKEYEVTANPLDGAPTVVTVQIEAGESVPIGLVVPDGARPDDVEYRISGLPTGVSFSSGLDLGNGQWRLRGDELAGLRLQSTVAITGDFNVAIETSVRVDGALVRDLFNAEETGWTLRSGAVAPIDDASGMLGPFSGTNGLEGVSRTYSVPAGIESVVVEFDFLERDSWDGERFLVFGNSQLISSQRYFVGEFANGQTAFGRDGDQAHTRAEADAMLGGNAGYSDQIHHYRLVVPVVDGKITLGFGSTLNQSIGDESWAIDHLVISENHGQRNTMQLKLTEFHEPDINVVEVIGEPSEGELRLLLDTQESQEQRITSVVVTGVPTNVELSAGTRAGDGSVMLAANELENLILRGEFKESVAIQVRTNFAQIKTLFEEDFENGAEGWSANIVQSSSSDLTSFMGRFNDSHDGVAYDIGRIEKTFVIDPTIEEIFIEFDQLQLDQMQSDQFVVFINGEAISASELRSALRLDAEGNAVLDAVSDGSGNIGNVAFGAGPDGVNHYVLRVATHGGPLTVGFASQLNTGLNQASWGIDNFRIVTIEQTSQVDGLLIKGVLDEANPRNLIANGSFEVFTNAKDTTWGNATQSLAGWALEAGTRFETLKPRADVSQGEGGANSAGGLNTANMALSQHIDGVETGATYELTFNVADSAPSDTDSLEVFWNGEKIADIKDASTDWQSFTFRVVGGSGDGSNTLTFKGTSGNDDIGVALKDVELYQVAPAPVTAPENEDVTIVDGDRTPLHLVGSEGNDVLIGGAGGDTIEGGGGDDVLLGDPDGAMRFDGTNDYLTVDATDMPFTDSFTIAARAKLDSVMADNWDVIIEKVNDNGKNDFMLGFVEGKLVVEINDDDIWEGGADRQKFIIADTADLIDDYHDYVVTFANGKLDVYIDGNLAKSIEGLGEFRPSQGGRVIIGADVDTDYVPTSDRFSGEIADVQLYNRAISASEIDSVRQGVIVDDSLVAHFDFDSDDPLADKSGNGFDGTPGRRSTIVSEAGSDDILIGGEGDDFIDGGAGFDVARFSGSIEDYEIVRLEDGTLRLLDVTGKGDGLDLVRNVERFVFADATYSVEDLPISQELGAIFDTRYSGMGGRIWGDPHFVGDDGDKFDIQGEVNHVYSIVSDSDLQINSKFIAWGNAGATVMGEVGILAGDNQIQIAPGKAPLFNGTPIQQGAALTIDGVTVSFDGRNTVVITAEYKTTWISQGNNYYLDARLEPTDPFADKVAPHGLWGLTVDADQQAKIGDDIWNSGNFKKSQGGGAIDTLDENGEIVQSERGDIKAYKLYETTGLFSTKTTMAEGAEFIRFNAAVGTGLNQTGQQSSGTSGNDILRSASGQDDLDGGAGDDIVIGGEGDDKLSGGEGNDRVIGGTGNDVISGGAGDDLLNGGENDDIIDGGDGFDTAKFAGSIADYEIIRLDDGSIRMLDLSGHGDGLDIVQDVEKFVFADATYTAENLPITRELGAIFDTRYSGMGGRIWGDPHFIGDDGGRYDVQGEANAIYSIVSDQDLQINAQFKAWGSGGATVMGKIGILSGTDQIEIAPGKSPVVNGQLIPRGGSLTVNGTTISYDGVNTVVTTAEYKTTWISQGGHTYFDARLEPTDPYADNVAPHGLWGLTVDADTAAKNGDGGAKVQGGGAIDTLDANGEVQTTARGDREAYKLYETTGLFSTTTKLPAGAEFIRFAAEEGTGLNQIGQQSNGTDEGDILRGGAGNDVLSGGRGDDVLVGGSGDDLLDGGEGSDFIIGGEGNDTLLMKGSVANYEITRLPDGSFRVVNTQTGGQEVDVIKEIENFRFADGAYTEESLPIMNRMTDLGGVEGGQLVAFKITADHYDPRNIQDDGAGSPKYQIFVNGELFVDTSGNSTFEAVANRNRVVADGVDRSGDGVADKVQGRDVNDFEFVSVRIGNDVVVKTAEIRFVNDAWDGTTDNDRDGIFAEDRNLIVDHVHIGGDLHWDGTYDGGRTIEAEDNAHAMRVLSNNQHYGSEEGMYWTGNVSFFTDEVVLEKPAVDALAIRVTDNVGTLTASGKAAPYNTVEVLDGGKVIATAYSDLNGNWSINQSVSANSNGGTLEVRATDNRGAVATTDEFGFLRKAGSGNDSLVGGAFDDKLKGGAGDDTLRGGEGDDILQGNDGFDTAEFSGSITDYEIVRLADGSIRLIDLTGSGDGSDIAKNIERFTFADASYTLENLPISHELGAIYDTRYSGMGGRIWGDPHFIGDDGGRYDVQGEAGAIYSIVSDSDLQINAQFQAYGSGGATTMGKIGILAGEEQIEISPGRAPLVNGVAVPRGGVLNVNGITISYDGRNTVVTTAEYKTTWISQGSYFDARLEPTDPFADNVAPHGLWGLTVDADTTGLNGDRGAKVQGGGAIDTLDAEGNEVTTARGDRQSHKLYETTGLFSTTTKLPEGAAFIRYGAAEGTGLREIGIETDGTAGSDILRGDDIHTQINGGAGDDVIVGGDADNNLDGGIGNDIIRGGAGNDSIDGGTGHDMAYYTGNRADFRLSTDGENVLVTDLRTGEIDTLESIEQLRFDDGMYALGSAGTNVDLEVEIPSHLSAAMVTVRGVPQGAVLTQGQDLGNGAWMLTSEQAQTVSLRTPTNFAGDVNLELTVTGRVAGGGLGQVTTTTSAVVVASADPTNLIANGSFENTGDVQLANGGWAAFKQLDGWKLESGTHMEVVDSGHRGVNATDGENWLDMENSPGNVVVSQQVLGLEFGQVYELTFDTINTGSQSDNGLAVMWNGEKVFAVASESGHHVLQVRAGSGDGSNTLVFASNDATPDNVGLALDNVRMTATDNLVVNGSFENLLGTVDKGWGHSGKNIQGWTLEETGRVVSVEDFENGAEGWSNNTTTDSGNTTLTEFLGRFGGSNGLQAVSKTFELGDEPYAVVEFDFLKLDSWDSNNAWGRNEAFNIFINDGKLLDFVPEGNHNGVQTGLDAVTGVNGNVRFVITSSGSDSAMFGANPNGEWLERVYHVRLEIVNPGDDLKLGFGSTLNQGLNDESFGIDNVRVYGADNPGTELRPDGTFAASGNAFEVHRPRSGVVASDGDYWLDLGGSASNVTIAQQIPGVVNGQSYVLSFDLADSIQDQTDGVDVIWNGRVIAHIDGQDASMDKFEFTVEGGTGDGTNTLKFRGTGQVDNFGVSLDDVRVAPGEVDLIEFSSERSSAVINGFNLDSTPGVKVYAQRVDANGDVVGPAELTVERDGRIGVAGTIEAGVFNQIGFNPHNSVAEQVVLEFEHAVTGGQFSFTNLYRGEGTAAGGIGDEQARWEAFSDGRVVASGVFTAQTSNTGTVQIELPPGVTADKIAFTPTEYSGGQNGSTRDSSDFFISSVEVDLVDLSGEGHFAGEAGNVIPIGIQLAENLDGELSAVRISGMPNQAALTSGERQPDGSWIVPASELGTLGLRSATTFSGELNLEVEAIAVSSFAPNMVVNGSFEDNTMSTKSWDVFREVPGWKTSNGEGIEIQENVAGRAADGIAKVELDSHDFGGERLGTNSGMYQEVPTDEGGTYVLTFQYSPRPGVSAASNGIEVLWNGRVIDTITADGVGKGDTQWTTHQYTVEGTAGSGRIEFRAVGTQDSLGGYIDDVTMQAATLQKAPLKLQVSEASDPTNLLANGSFENTNGVAIGDNSWVGTKSLPGWTLVSGQQFEVVDSGHRGVEATDGNNWLDMDASPGAVAIAQDVVGLEPGRTYELTLDTINTVINGQIPQDNAIEIYFGGEKVLEIPAGTEITQSHFVELRAGSGDGSDQLLIKGIDTTPDGIGMAIDNLRLEPSSNLIINGSFENLTGTTKQGFGHTAQSIQGWTLEGGDRFEVHNPRGGVTASDGEYWLDMGGSPSNIQISQQVPAVVEGETYRLSFDLADSIHDRTDGLQVIWNGEVIATINNQDATMTKFEMEVIGGSGDGSNKLTFRGTGNVDNFGVSLDSVRLEEGDLSDDVDFGFDRETGEVYFSEGEITMHSVGPGANLSIAVNESIHASNQYEVQFEFEAASNNWHNSFFAFDYENPENFKYAGARVGANYWTIGEFRDGNFHDLVRLPENILEDTPTDIRVIVDDGFVRLMADGVEKARYDFGFGFESDQVGLVNQNAHTVIRDFQMIDRSEPKDTLEIIDFSR